MNEPSLCRQNLTLDSYELKTFLNQNQVTNLKTSITLEPFEISKNQGIDQGSARLSIPICNVDRPRLHKCDTRTHLADLQIGRSIVLKAKLHSGPAI